MDLDLSRYLDLYLAETREHLRVLSRALLELEGAAPAGRVEAAFRSAHTIKGLAATMGHARVAEAAHRLEDGLVPLRGTEHAVPAAAVDELLAAADTLERALEIEIALPAGSGAAGAGAAGSAAAE
jgi:two-component system, chemotaxis family, sensor kinase CheA